MELTKEGLVAIYYQDDKTDCLLLKSIALVDYNVITKSFVVMSGEFIGYTNSDFNRIIGSGDYIFNDKVKLTFVDNKKEFSTFIITEKHIKDAFSIDIKASAFDVYCDLTQRLSGVVLIKRKNRLMSMFEFPRFIANTANGNFSEEKIEQMLNVEDPNDDLNSDEIETIITTNLPYGMQIIMGTSDNVKEANNSQGIGNNIEVNKDELANFNNININDVIKDINSKIVGQEKAVETLVTNIYYNQILIDSLSNGQEIDLSELDSRKISILLDGSTGTGKTAILKEIASKLDLPIDIVNANSFSETGYVGPTITDILTRLLQQTKGNIALAERGIIVLDEIDKIATPIDYDGRDMKKGVQEELLSFIGGGKYDISTSNGFLKSTISFDTSKITFILSGAFTKLRDNKIKEQEKKINGMGFNTSYNKGKNEYEITSQDYIDYGLMREFFGRIKVLTSTKTYTIDDLKKILLESKISPLKNLEKTVQMFGYNKLNYNEDFVNKICEEAYKLDTGARGLQSIMSGIQNKILMDLINQSYNTNEPIEIDNNILSEYKKDNVRTYTRKK